MKHIFLAILAKQAEPYLPRYLACIDALDYPKEDITVYIRANNCTDQTIPLLQAWDMENHEQYRNFIVNYVDVPEQVERFQPGEWNAERFAVLGEIRQHSLKIAQAVEPDFYFCADVDNYIEPHTLIDLVQLNLPIVAPMLESCQNPQHPYRNFHAHIDERGYYLPCLEYWTIIGRHIKGIFEVPVVHCTYLVRADCIPKLSYLPDGTGRHEYVLFSESARKAGILQYIDNRTPYGCLETPWIINPEWKPVEVKNG